MVFSGFMVFSGLVVFCGLVVLSGLIVFSGFGATGHLKSNILVSGGIRGEIRMFHPENKVS